MKVLILVYIVFILQFLKRHTVNLFSGQLQGASEEKNLSKSNGCNFDCFDILFFVDAG